MQVINNKYKNIRVICKYLQEKLDKNTFYFYNYLNNYKNY